MMKKRHAFEKCVPGKGFVFDRDKAREKWNTYVQVDVDGIVRWKSNGSVPPQDCMEDFMEVGLLDEHTFQRSLEVDKKETAKSLAEYRKRMKNHVPSAEERFEMRAAFGPGAEVTNILTGKKTKL